MRRILTVLTIVALAAMAAPGQAALMEDLFERPDGTGVGTTTVGGFAWTERNTFGAGLDAAGISGGMMHIYGGGGPTPANSHDHGQTVMLGQAPSYPDAVRWVNLDVAADLRFYLNSTTNGTTHNTAGFMLRKPGAGADIGNANQILVEILPTGGLMLRDRAGGGLNVLYADNPFLPGDEPIGDLNIFPAAGSLPATFGGAPFDANGNGRLEFDEPFRLGAVLSGNRLQVLVNGQPVAAVTTNLDDSTAGTQTMSLLKNRFTGSGTRTIADPFFDNLTVSRPDYVVRHVGATDPLLENWTLDSTDPTSGTYIEYGPVSGDQGMDAWRIDDKGGRRHNYQSPLTARELEIANEVGWKYTMQLRTTGIGDDVSDFSVSGEVATNSRRFVMRFGSDADGNGLVELNGSGQGPHTIPGGSVYHTFDLVFDPLLGTDGEATLYVDGGAVETGYTSFGSGFNRLVWGSNHSATSGEANYSLVDFEVNPLPEDVLMRHRADIDPALEGWSRFANNTVVSEGPVTGAGGQDAWQIDDPGGGLLYYQARPIDGTLDFDSLAEVERLGWTYTARLELLDVNDPVDGSVEVLFADSQAAYALNIGTNADGDPIVKLLTGVSGGQLLGPEAELAGLGPGFHTYQMVGDADGVVSLLVDGAKVLDGFTGWSGSVNRNMIRWGSNATAAAGAANWALVEFQVNAVPEPSTLALLAIGIGGLALAARKRRLRRQR